ncbi:MAG: hypothetical protein JNL28_13520 [Planctomycetes bacterium]|nr:hypothetical protein [Planctomycetota bacterium]
MAFQTLRQSSRMAVQMSTTYGVRPMSTEKPLEHTIHPGSPTLILVKGQDGKEYAINVQLAVIGIRQTEAMSPKTGQPAFEINFTVGIFQRPSGA